MSTKPQFSFSLAVTALREIAVGLHTAWSLDSILDLIARKTSEVLQVDSCSIYLLDTTGDTLRLQATTGLADRALGRATLLVGEGMTGLAVQRNEPVYAADAQNDPHFKLVREAEETAFYALLAVPLVVNGRPIGAINVQKKIIYDFGIEEIDLLLLIADLAAGTIAKAQLYETQKRQIDELSTVAKVSEAVTSPQYLDDILHVVTEMAAQTLDVAVCSIFLLDDAGTHLELHSAKRTSESYIQHAPLAIDEAVIGEVIKRGKPIYIEDVRTDGRYLRAELARSEGMVSLLAVPLRVRERVIGVFSCYTDRPRQFSQEEESLLLTLANQTALAIENSRLATNAAIVREMHHRIKNNLQTVAMLMQLQLPDAAQLDTRHVLETNIHRIHSIASVHDVLSHKGFRYVDVRDVLERIMHTTMEMMLPPEQQISIRVYGVSLLLPSHAATVLTLIVNELVQNALEHAFVDRAKGKIEISLGHSPDEIIVIVRDDGVGFVQDHQTGLGLEIVESLVMEDLNGRLRFRAGEFGGSEAVIRLPRSLES